MKKQVNPTRKSKITRHAGSARKTDPVLGVLGFTFLLCLLGCMWEWKENWHERLSTHMLALEKTQRELQEQWGILQADLSELSQYTHIELMAREHLGMVSPRVPPDTIWCAEAETPALMGSVIFYDLNCKGR